MRGWEGQPIDLRKKLSCGSRSKDQNCLELQAANAYAPQWPWRERLLLLAWITNIEGQWNVQRENRAADDVSHHSAWTSARTDFRDYTRPSQIGGVRMNSEVLQGITVCKRSMILESSPVAVEGVLLGFTQSRNTGRSSCRKMLSPFASVGVKCFAVIGKRTSDDWKSKNCTSHSLHCAENRLQLSVGREKLHRVDPVNMAWIETDAIEN